jgi:2-dehydro-3-deoxygluconokinase
MIGEVTSACPNVKMVATTMREVESAIQHQRGAVLSYDGRNYVSPTCEVNVNDRYRWWGWVCLRLDFRDDGWLSPRKSDAVRLGTGALLTTFPGRRYCLPEVEPFAIGDSARVQR